VASSCYVTERLEEPLLEASFFAVMSLVNRYEERDFERRQTFGTIFCKAEFKKDNISLSYYYITQKPQKLVEITL
jgi:hypothetical protein